MTLFLGDITSNSSDGGDLVTSVNGQQGDVVLNGDNIPVSDSDNRSIVEYIDDSVNNIQLPTFYQGHVDTETQLMAIDASVLAVGSYYEVRDLDITSPGLSGRGIANNSGVWDIVIDSQRSPDGISVVFNANDELSVDEVWLDNKISSAGVGRQKALLDGVNPSAIITIDDTICVQWRMDSVPGLYVWASNTVGQITVSGVVLYGSGSAYQMYNVTLSATPWKLGFSLGAPSSTSCGHAEVYLRPVLATDNRVFNVSIQLTSYGAGTMFARVE